YFRSCDRCLSARCYRTDYWSILRMVSYIDDSRFRGWQELPGDCHVRGVSYHPSLRSYFSSLGLELPHKQFHGFKDYEASFAECNCKLLQLVYRGSKACEQSPSDQRPVSGLHHSPWVSEVDNDGIHASLFKPFSRVFVVESHQSAKSRLVDVRLRCSQEFRPHLISK